MTPTANALSVKGLVKEFFGVRALAGVDLNVAGGSVHALLGGNGSGKSTLIKALAGVQPAESGEFSIGDRHVHAPEMTAHTARQLGLRFVHQELPVFPSLTVAENLAIGHGWDRGPLGRIRWRAQRNHAEEVLQRFSIEADPRAALATLSVATQTMVTVARAMQDLEGAGILVLDEPTSSFPPAQVTHLLDFVHSFAAQGHSVVYVTHRLDEVIEVADEVTILRDGHLQEILTRESGSISQKRLTNAIVGAAKGSTPSNWSKVNSTEPATVEVRALTGGPVQDVSFTLRPGEIVGLAGLLGSGRSSLLKQIFGALEAESGSVTVGGKTLTAHTVRDAMGAGIAYIPEDRGQEAAFPNMSVLENLVMSAPGEFFMLGRRKRPTELRIARRLIDDFHVNTFSSGAALSTLSGGNQQKVILARWLRLSPKLILLDEPTHGVDVGARAEIWKLIREATRNGACALVASSDLQELATFCDRALIIRNGQIVDEADATHTTKQYLERHAFGMEEAS